MKPTALLVFALFLALRFPLPAAAQISDSPPDIEGKALVSNAGASPIVQPKTHLEKIFYHYAGACYGLNWEFIREVAKAESNLKPALINDSGYRGLFQFHIRDCPDTLRLVTPAPDFVSCSKENLFDPEINTALGASRFDYYFSRAKFALEKKCAGASILEKTTLSYVMHNNGPGVFKHVINHLGGDCSEANQIKWVRDFYESNGRDDGMYVSRKTKELIPCDGHEELAKNKTKTVQCVSADYGERKWRFGRKKIAEPVEKAGITRLYSEGAADDSQCPLKTGARLYPEAPKDWNGTL